MLPASFLYRDFIQYILPTIIAFCLFLPFIGYNSLPLQDSVLFAAILSYVIHPVIGRLNDRVYARFHLPYIAKKIKEIEVQEEWTKNNWDCEELLYALKDSERESIFSTKSYKGFYEAVSFYFLLYFILNIGYFLDKLILLCRVTNMGEVHYLSNIYSIKTSLLGKLQIPTCIIILISLIIFYYLFKDYLILSDNISGRRGIYYNFAKKYHKKNGNIAVSIWGRVMKDTQSVPDANLELWDNENNLLGQARSNSNGLFQFQGKYKENIGKTVIIRVVTGQTTQSKDYPIIEKELPYFEVKIDEKLGSNIRSDGKNSYWRKFIKRFKT